MSFDDIHRAIRVVMSKQIFFVVGCQKSGTTWAQHIIDAHPQACCRGEAAFGTVFLPVLQQIGKAYNEQQRLRNDQHTEISSNDLMNDEHLQYMFASMSAMMMSQWFDLDDPSIIAVGEKTPEHATSLPAMAITFPGCKIISGWFHNLRVNGEKLRSQFKSMAAYAAYFLEHHWLFYLYSCRTFQKTNPKQYHELRYEDLHESPQGSIRAMLGFLNLDCDDQLVARCGVAGSFAKITGRKAGVENRQSFYRKGIAGDWRNHMDEESCKITAYMAGPQMQELGYEPAARTLVKKTA